MIRQPDPDPLDSCGFVAGTLIHTKTGLVPIEQVQVGDWVWSQAPTGPGAAQAWKQVTATSAFEDREVVLVRCYQPGGPVLHELCMARNHLFWTIDEGWTRADWLGWGRELALADADVVAITLCALRVCLTHAPGWGWVSGAWGERNDNGGHLVDLRNGAIAIAEGEAYNMDFLDDEGNYAPFRMGVFNLDVEGFHTYYVGAMGLWVHGAHPLPG